MVAQWELNYGFDQFGNDHTAYSDVGDDYEAVHYWTDVVAITAGAEHIAGLKADGTVVADDNSYFGDFGQCEVSGWANIKLPSISKKR